MMGKLLQQKFEILLRFLSFIGDEMNF